MQIKKETISSLLDGVLAKKETILSKLDEVHALEAVIEKRISQKSTAAHDNKGIELNPKNIKIQIEALANKLMHDLPNANPILIAIMDGAMPFAAEMNRVLSERNYNFQFTSMQVSSYQGTTSTGKVTIKAEPKILLGGRTVILVDDVCDTGDTCKAIKTLFHSRGALNTQLLVLVDKLQPRAEGCNPDYAGFTLSKDDFIIGMGMDFDGGQRNLPDIRIVDPTSLPTTEENVLLDTKPLLNNQLQECIADETEALKKEYFVVSDFNFFTEVKPNQPIIFIEDYLSNQ